MMMLPMIRDAAAREGSVATLARKLGVPRENLYVWRRVPAHHAIRFERVTGISRHITRPDIYPPFEDEVEIAARGSRS